METRDGVYKDDIARNAEPQDLRYDHLPLVDNLEAFLAERSATSSSSNDMCADLY